MSVDGVVYIAPPRPLKTCNTIFGTRSSLTAVRPWRLPVLDGCLSLTVVGQAARISSIGIFDSNRASHRGSGTNQQVLLARTRPSDKAHVRRTGATFRRNQPVREIHRSDITIPLVLILIPAFAVAVLVETPIMVDEVAWEQGVMVRPAGG